MKSDLGNSKSDLGFTKSDLGNSKSDLGNSKSDLLHAAYLPAACAEAAGCDHLLSCDNRFRKRYKGPITVLNPADFVLAWFQQTP